MLAHGGGGGAIGPSHDAATCAEAPAVSEAAPAPAPPSRGANQGGIALAACVVQLDAEPSEPWPTVGSNSGARGAAAAAGVEEWDVRAVCAWFAQLELGAYVDSVRANSVDGLVLVGLSDDDLVELGIANKFHRRKVLSHRGKVLSGAASLRSPPRAAASHGSASRDGTDPATRSGFASARYAPEARERLAAASEPGSCDGRAAVLPLSERPNFFRTAPSQALSPKGRPGY